ncbi:MAG: biosynthetic-type acetolactate synthase large subunit, partial [Acetanaerobacterium sp.]
MKLTGAQILIQTLLEQEVDTVFGYPGGQVLNIYDELYKSADQITHYITAHEQGAAHAADCYARASGKTGVVIATSGPGATNLVTGIATAYLDSTPLVAITGNVPTALIGRDSFQEVDITGITMPITKHNYIVKDVARLADTVREAFLIANSGRKGPVLIDIPKDVQVAPYEYERITPCAVKTADAKAEECRHAAQLIAAAKRPYIYAGGGVVASEAQDELLALAEYIDAPIGLSMMGLTAVPNDHPRNLGMMGMHGRYAANRALHQSDLILAVGTRFSDRATGNKTEFSDGRTVVHIDIDPAEIGKNISAYTGVIGDIKGILTTLLSMMEKTSRPEWHAETQGYKSCPQNCIDMEKGQLTPQLIIETVGDYAQDDTVVATDVGQHQMWTAQYYPFKKPRTFATSGGLGTMGFGLGAAIGACIARGKQRTVLFTSDGSFHMNLNELATAVSFELPIVVVVLNNNALGMVRQWQTQFFGKRYSQTSLNRKTDFVKLTEAFGGAGTVVRTPGELDDAVKQAFAY